MDHCQGPKGQRQTFHFKISRRNPTSVLRSGGFPIKGTRPPLATKAKAHDKWSYIKPIHYIHTPNSKVEDASYAQIL